ncbi:GumC family protein [Roseobacter sp. EG26]|uniref:GumC family protein n=1 Tax=Roseobacter sp. EG26 TaxID=3412477 RepID=UPI002614682B|nr:Wzz/FepE/Etk N-terminal domain-containing protein [uncultured Roseobacter sp.]
MNLDLQFYWGLLLRRLPVMMALFLVCVVSAGVTALKLPPTYSTSAQLLVEEPQIPDSMVAAIVQTDANQQLQVIEQKLLTRANMLDIARKFNVFEGIRSMAPDAIVEGMRGQTDIRRTGGRGQATLMSVAFEARSGAIAANVVNEYMTLILQESSDFRMSRAESTLSFFEQEVERLGDDLDQQSARLVEFKNANSEALPGDLNYRQNRQTLLQERQARLERDVAALVKQRRDMVAIFEATGRVNAERNIQLSPEEEQLERLRFDLEQALGIYSETNPRISVLRNRIAKLEKSLQDRADAAPKPEEGEEPRTVTVLDLTLAEMDQRLESMEQELGTVTKELEALEASIQATAGNAIVLSGLERDFGNIQTRYNEAVRNLNQARVNERIEVSAQGQRISVIESASVPQEPSGPNRFKFIAAGIAAGGGLAVGFFVLLELLNRNIRRPFELQSKYGIIPLAVIPYMEARRERMIRRLVLVGAFVAVLIGVPAVLWYIDTNYMPLDILANKVFDRLGLT